MAPTRTFGGSHEQAQVKEVMIKDNTSKVIGVTLWREFVQCIESSHIGKIFALRGLKVKNGKLDKFCSTCLI